MAVTSGSKTEASVLGISLDCGISFTESITKLERLVRENKILLLLLFTSTLSSS